MTYAQDQDILAADFNAFRTTLLRLYGQGGTGNGAPDGTYGYGQSALPLDLLHVNDDILSTQALNLRTMIATIAQHQGTSVSLPTTGMLASGQECLASPPATGDFPGSISSVNTNRLTIDPASGTVFLDQLTSSRSTSWHSHVEHVFKATFPDTDHARYFFNAGGQIRFRESRSGGTVSAQNTWWTSTLIKAGTVVFGANNTSNGVLSPVAIGYYQLTGAYQTIFTQTLSRSGVNYGGNEMIISAKVNVVDTTNGGTGAEIQFRVEFIDTYVPIPDLVDGTLTSTVDLFKATSPFTITSPTLATTIALTSSTYDI